MAPRKSSGGTKLPPVFVVVIRLVYVSLLPALSADQITAEVSIPELRLYIPLSRAHASALDQPIPAAPDGQLWG